MSKLHPVFDLCLKEAVRQSVGHAEEWSNRFETDFVSGSTSLVEPNVVLGEKCHGIVADLSNDLCCLECKSDHDAVFLV